MNKEDKSLLLQDISARLPYGVFVETTWAQQLTDVSGTIGTLRAGQIELFEDGDYSEIKPYLRPISSMTEEEKRHISKMMCLRTYDNGIVYDMAYPVYTPYYVMEDCLSYLRSIHMDYSGMIEKGLALEAPKDMYNLK